MYCTQYCNLSTVEKKSIRQCFLEYSKIKNHLAWKLNLIENDQIHCLYVRKHKMCFWPNLRTKWKNNLALISTSILFFCFCKHFKKNKRNISYLPFCNKKISSIFGRIIFSPPYTNYPQYTTYGWIRNEKTTKITTSCSVHRVNKCVCKIQFRTWFRFIPSAGNFKIIKPHSFSFEWKSCPKIDQLFYRAYLHSSKSSNMRSKAHIFRSD